ncbi:type II toxin-antitoxin system PemK/MazF family toxin [Sulfurovum sp. bin170]|uniref:type II toxin-antitoxin system PemK/MazF family toxin n=1 Tax=Sulfurovum sp. bin170 TaxID=2695268 RepID=UPI001CB71F1F|nr:type II toxin-antitoxin system PemK/MazF family toxin [Sulfurovum sp. bin170]
MTIKQSEIWLVNLNPTIGTEINKTRPCLVIGDDTIGKLKSKTVLPITGWSETYSFVPWMVKCEPTKDNHLTKDSAIDTFQIRNLSTKRFIKKIGVIDSELLFVVHSIVAQTLSVRYKLVVD